MLPFLSLFSSTERIIIGILSVTLIFAFVIHEVQVHSYETQISKLETEYKAVLQDVVTERSNNELLKSTILKQNSLVDEFKKKNIQYETQISSLNSTIKDQNIQMKKLLLDGVKLPTNVKTSEDAILWLRTNSKSLQ